MICNIAGLVLAGGSSRRMSGQHKLLAPVMDIPLVCRSVDAVLGAAVASTTVVTGAGGDEIAAALDGRNIQLLFNEDYRSGLASSLQRGLAGLPQTVDGVLVMLADMPLLTAGHLDCLIESFSSAGARKIVAPRRGERLGNPVIWPVEYIPQLMLIRGDRGGKALLSELSQQVLAVPTEEEAYFFDVDTAAELERLRLMTQGQNSAPG